MATTSVDALLLYGGTYNQFKVTLPRLGINVEFAKDTSRSPSRRSIDAHTKAIYVETIGNPRFSVPDFRALKAVALKHGIPVICDNTFGACGYVCQPLKRGADIVVESAARSGSAATARASAASSWTAAR